MSGFVGQIVNEVNGTARLVSPSGRVRHLLFDFEAVTQLEAITGKSAFDLLAGRPGPTDVTALLICGAAGYNRRNGAAEKPLNPKLAQRFIIDCGGVLPMLPTLVRSLSMAEGLGLDNSDDDEDDDQDEGDSDAEAGGARPPGLRATS